MRKGEYKIRVNIRFAPAGLGSTTWARDVGRELCVHSYLSAVIGSSFAARNAG